MDDKLELIYRDIISVLDYVEIAVQDNKQFLIIRKKLLDIANDVKRCKDNGYQQ